MVDSQIKTQRAWEDILVIEYLLLEHLKLLLGWTVVDRAQFSVGRKL
jgi:hypothetical protein